MKNVSLYCGLTDARMRASEKDLPVKITYFLYLEDELVGSSQWGCKPTPTQRLFIGYQMETTII